MRKTHLIRRAYKVGKEEGPGDLVIKSTNYLRNRVLARFKKQLNIECDGVSVTFDTTNQIAKDWFYPRYASGQLHEPAFTRRLLNTLDRDNIFYDIGANVGYFTVLASEVCTNGEVHSFELNSKFVNSIKSSLQKNGTSAVITQKAVSDNSEKLVQFTNSTIPHIEYNQQQSGSVNSITLDEYAKSNPIPEVIKIDVEGYEGKILRGAQETLSHPNMETIFVEVHPSMLKQYGDDKHKIFANLEKLGYDCYGFNNHRDAGSYTLKEVDSEEIDSITMLECRR